MTRPITPSHLAVAAVGLFCATVAAHPVRGQGSAAPPAGRPATEARGPLPPPQAQPAPTQQPQQPPALSPEQQAALDRLLAAWEARNAAVRTWSCTFHKWEYNAWSPAGSGGDRLAFAESTGELKYAAPDKGLFRVKETKQWNPEARRYEVRGADTGEHWVCNGESIYEFRHADSRFLTMAPTLTMTA